MFVIKSQHLFFTYCWRRNCYNKLLLAFISSIIDYRILINHHLPGFAGIAETASIELENNSFLIHNLQENVYFKIVTIACIFSVVFPFNKQY